jgi:predicted nucleotidyltransferase
MAISQQARDEVIRRIVEAVDPIRIILFGSAARGEEHEGSDVDLLVVMPDGAHRRHTAQAIYPSLLGTGVAVDVLVATPSDLERYGDSPGLVYREIMREGVELYAA